MSALEETLALQLRAVKLTPEREYRFAPPRRWRFDFAFPAEQVAVEVDGGHWTNGRHVRGAGFERDCEKLNAAAERGWRVLRYTSTAVRSGEAIQQIERVIGTRELRKTRGE